MSWLTPWKRRGSVHPLVSLQEEMNRLFDHLWSGDYDVSSLLRRGWAPPLDVVETDEAVIVKAEVPGMDPKDIDISVTGGVLTITGEKRDEREEKGKRVVRIERAYGSFTRSIDVPEAVDPGQISAEYKDGILTITLPKKPEAKAKSVKIEVK